MYIFPLFLGQAKDNEKNYRIDSELCLDLV